MDMAVPKYFHRRMSRCALLELCCDPALTRASHVLHTCIRTTMASSSNGDVCLINDVSLRFPFLFTERNMQRISKNQRYSFEVACKHTSHLHAWRKDLGPLCSPISKSLHLQQDCADYNTNRWKDFLAISTEAHASCFSKQSSICDYKCCNIKGAPPRAS